MKDSTDHQNRQPAPPQAAFLVRCWRDGGADAGAWRYSLESVATRQRQGFDSGEELLEGLRARLPGSEVSESEAITHRKEDQSWN